MPLGGGRLTEAVRSRLQDRALLSSFGRLEVLEAGFRTRLACYPNAGRSCARVRMRTRLYAAIVRTNCCACAVAGRGGGGAFRAADGNKSASCALAEPVLPWTSVEVARASAPAVLKSGFQRKGLTAPDQFLCHPYRFIGEHAHRDVIDGDSWEDGRCVRGVRSDSLGKGKPHGTGVSRKADQCLRTALSTSRTHLDDGSPDRGHAVIFYCSRQLLRGCVSRLELQPPGQSRRRRGPLAHGRRLELQQRRSSATPDGVGNLGGIAHVSKDLACRLEGLGLLGLRGHRISGIRWMDGFGWLAEVHEGVRRTQPLSALAPNAGRTTNPPSASTTASAVSSRRP